MQNPTHEDLRRWWDVAVPLGARGYVCAGEAVLARTERRSPAADPVVASLVGSTRASWIRQAGGHRRAAEFDGVAVRLALGAVEAGSSSAARAALADAMIGLAADNLGVGRFAVSDRLLERAEREVLCTLDPAEGFRIGDRVRLRWRWVRTELALYGGDPTGAARFSADGVELARSVPSVRHRVKTDLIAAAAAAVNGDLGAATRLASSTAATCAQVDLLPLQWAALTMLGGLKSDNPAESGRISVELEAVTARLRRRGMVV